MGKHSTETFFWIKTIWAAAGKGIWNVLLAIHWNNVCNSSQNIGFKALWNRKGSLPICIFCWQLPLKHKSIMINKMCRTPEVTFFNISHTRYSVSIRLYNCEITAENTSPGVCLGLYQDLQCVFLHFPPKCFRNKRILVKWFSHTAGTQCFSYWERSTKTLLSLCLSDRGHRRICTFPLIKRCFVPVHTVAW